MIKTLRTTYEYTITEHEHTVSWEVKESIKQVLAHHKFDEHVCIVDFYKDGYIIKSLKDIPAEILMDLDSRMPELIDTVNTQNANEHKEQHSKAKKWLKTHKQPIAPSSLILQKYYKVIISFWDDLIENVKNNVELGAAVEDMEMRLKFYKYLLKDDIHNAKRVYNEMDTIIREEVPDDILKKIHELIDF